MMAKIEWYQEVLEQEPGSRVFFPLARLLEQVGQSEEALAVLRNGVAQNPDFLEARLMLIQLLHEQGHSSDCGAEVAKVANLFEVYPAFWDAWAESAAAVNRDLELALRFMAATFRRPDISLCDVLVSGLGKLLNRDDERLAVFGMTSTEALAPVLEAVSCEQPDVALPDEEAPQNGDDASALETALLPHEDACAPLCTSESEHTDVSETLSEEPEGDSLEPSEQQSDCTETFSEQPCAEQKIVEQPNEEIVLEQTSDRQGERCVCDDGTDAETVLVCDDPASDGSVASDASDPADDTVFLLKDIITDDVCTAVPADAPVVGEGVPADDVSDPEPTLRTRSMANVLAEQGDLAGALEIYQELEASAASPEEAQILHEYVAALGAHLTGTSVSGDSDGMGEGLLTTLPRSGSSTGASGKSPAFSKNAATASEAVDVAPPSQRKLMFLLESLADRLEARARA